MTKVGCSKEYWVSVILGSTHKSHLETGKLVVFFRWAKCILSEWWKNISTWYLISHFYWRQNARLNQTEPSHRCSIWGERFPKGPRLSVVSQLALWGRAVLCTVLVHQPWIDLISACLHCCLSGQTSRFLSKRHGASAASQPSRCKWEIFHMAKTEPGSQQLRFQTDLDNLLTPQPSFSHLWDSSAYPAKFKMLREFCNVSGSIWAPSKNDNCWGLPSGWSSPQTTLLSSDTKTLSNFPKSRNKREATAFLPS